MADRLTRFSLAIRASVSLACAPRNTVYVLSSGQRGGGACAVSASPSVIIVPSVDKDERVFVLTRTPHPIVPIAGDDRLPARQARQSIREQSRIFGVFFWAPHSSRSLGDVGMGTHGRPRLPGGWSTGFDYGFHGSALRLENLTVEHSAVSVACREREGAKPLSSKVINLAGRACPKRPCRCSRLATEAPESYPTPPSSRSPRTTARRDPPASAPAPRSPSPASARRR